MRRRDVFALLGGLAVNLPVTAVARPSEMSVIGFLSSASSEAFAPFVAAFHQGLAKLGYVEGQNVLIEYRWADGRFDRLPELAADLIGRGVRVVLSSGGNITALAAKRASTTVPIVFVSGGDPVRDGLVRSFNRPGGNITGVTFLGTDLMQKRLELLSEMIPATASIALLVNPNSPQAESIIRDVQEAARARRVPLHISKAGSEGELDGAFSKLVQLKAGALLVGADVFFNNRRTQLAALAVRHRIPALFGAREFVIAGGLASYGPSISAAYRDAGVYVGRILKGASPRDLPVQRSTTFELVVNRKTAEALGVGLPPSILARVDEVIE